MKRLEKNKISDYKSKFNIVNKELDKKDRRRIDLAVKRVVREYGETLRLLGTE